MHAMYEISHVYTYVYIYTRARRGRDGSRRSVGRRGFVGTVMGFRASRPADANRRDARARRRADDGAMDGARRARDDARAFASCATTTRVPDDDATREDDARRDDGRTTTTTTTRGATTRVRCDARGANADEGDDAKGAVTTARYAPAWAVGGGKGRARDAGRARDDGDDDDDAREGARGKKSAGKRSDAAFAVTVTRALERGTRGVVRVWSDAEAGGRCPSEARWDAQGDAERRMGRDDGDSAEFRAFHATVSAHSLTREAELELGSVHRDFGLEFRQSVTTRLDSGFAAPTSQSWSIGTPVKPFDAFKMLHGAEDDDVEKSGEAKARKDDEPPTARTSSAKFAFARNLAKPSPRLTFTAHSKPPSNARALDLNLRATSNALDAHALRVVARTRLGESRAQVAARTKFRGGTHGVDLELGRDFKPASSTTTIKAIIKASVPLTKYALKLSRDGGKSRLALELSPAECVVDARLRPRGALELRFGIKHPCALPTTAKHHSVSVGPRRRAADDGGDAFVAFAVAFAA